MGNGCGHCCTIETGVDDASTQRPSFRQFYASEKDFQLLVRAQACIRGWLARRKVEQVKQNPRLLPELFPNSARNRYENGAIKAKDQMPLIPYHSESVQNILQRMGEFRYVDQASLDAIDASGQAIQERETQTLADNMEQYTGEWSVSTGMRHGKGKLVILDGSTYEGFWLNDKKNGHGRFIHVDGDTYIGQFKDDMMHGTGTYEHTDGAKYIGEWANDQHHGLGKESWEDGAVYEG